MASPEEAEQALVNNPTDADEYEENGEIRYSEIGMTDAHQCLVVVTTWRGDRLRVVTAFPGSSAEVKFYLKPCRRR